MKAKSINTPFLHSPPNLNVLLLHTDPYEWVEVVDKLLLDDSPRDVAVVTVPGLIKQDVWVRVVRLTQRLEGTPHLVVLQQVIQSRVLDKLVDDALYGYHW